MELGAPQVGGSVNMPLVERGINSNESAVALNVGLSRHFGVSVGNEGVSANIGGTLLWGGPVSVSVERRQEPPPRRQPPLEAAADATRVVIEQPKE
jgi:hypothetical protein